MGHFESDSRITTEPPTFEALGTGAPAAADHIAAHIVPTSPLRTTFLSSIPSYRMADPIDSAL
jgi:hypothetical protein